MKTVLIIGGYGAFGGRLSQRLSDTKNVKVLVAGRTISKAKSLCDKFGGNLSPVFFDTKADLAKQLAALDPWLVIGAAGPYQPVFQTKSSLPEACTAQGCHYLDLSDSGEFTQSVCALDRKAKKAGVAIISAASTGCALSSAVVEAAQDNFAQVKFISGGISPGGKIDLGLSVTKAVLSYLGKPLKIFRDRKWVSEPGYGRIHKRTIAIKGEKPLRRWFGQCDAPDLLLFPDHYPTAQTVRFFGSQELWPIHQILRLLAWLQGRGIVKNLQNHARFFRWWGTTLGRFGSERGGMFMHIIGNNKDGNTVSQSWNLIASDGDGPFIPILAAEILTRRWLKQNPKPGARSAIGEIRLKDFEKAFKILSIKSAFMPLKPAPSLFQKALGESFDTLPAPVRKGHEVISYKTMTGNVDVVRGKNPLAGLIATFIGFPKTRQAAPISISMDVRGGKEVWTRIIGTSKFQSVLSAVGKPHEIYEQFGPVKFKIKFRLEDGRLHYDIVAACMFGIPIPKFLSPKSITHEREEAEKFIFDVDIKLPLLGRLISYKGWLE